MRWSIRIALALSLVVAACTSDNSGPELPRPQPETTSTTLVVTTTSTIGAITTTTTPTECAAAFCLVYHLDSSATWSDGSPVTAEDWQATAQIYRRVPSPEPNEAYRDLSSVDVVDVDTVRFNFSAPVGGWEHLFPRLVPPDFTEWQPGQVTAGPFTLTEWVPGDRIVVERNSNWTTIDPVSGAPAGSVEEITFVFVPSADEMYDRLVEGTIDVMLVRPEVGLVADVAASDDLDYVIAPGGFWEHLDFHHEDPLLSQDWVREAFDLAIDRQKLLDRTVRQFDSEWPSLDSTAWMGDSFRYRPHYVDRYDPDRAEQILVDQGCVRGGSTYTCGEREMSFLWGTTSDDPLRAAIFESVAEDLAGIGIEVVGAFQAPSQFVSREFLYGGPEAWQLIQFAWRATGDPADAIDLYRCEPTDRNVNRFCSESIDEMTRTVASIVASDARAEQLHEIDQAYLDELALIPLYQKPRMIAWRAGLGGPAPNYNVSSDLWNIAAWTGRESLVIALPSEPLELDPRVTTDDSANAVLATLMYGAFSMTPNQTPVPTLIETVELIEN